MRDVPGDPLVVRWRLPVLAGLLVAACLAGVSSTSPAVQAVVAVVVLVLTARLVKQALRHLRLARALDDGSVAGTLTGIAVRWRPLRPGAAVAGLRRPAIYCDPRLRAELTSGELDAVVLHERAHQLRRDPLRLLALATIEPVVSTVRPGRAWVERQQAALEVRADRFALGHGVDRADLAGAILKLGASVPAGTAAAFSSAAELRLRSLVDHPGEDRFDPHPRAAAGIAVAVGGVVAACAAAVVHHVVPLGGNVGCALAGC